jgi:AraC-like DNA-binding protein
VNQLRLQKARELLLKDNHSSVQEIALQVGFNSSSYFSAAFRKHYGITPSLMRKIGYK